MAYMHEARVYPFAFGSFKAPEVTWHHEDGTGEPYFTYVYSCQAVELKVDPVRGRVQVLNIVAAHDIGRAVNREMLEGQIYGGVVQGLGMALYEDLQVAGGKPRALNFNNYRIPRSVDLGEIKAIIVENNDPTSPFGCKGIGEPALELIAPALANALYRATGQREYSLPIPVKKLLNRELNK